jgi:hypothetical protein
MRNYYLLCAVFIVCATVILPFVFDNENARMIISFDLLQTALFFVVGSIWNTEYSNLTIKNPVMNHSRAGVFASKLFVIFTICAVLFALYAAMQLKNANSNALIPQAVAMFAHTALLIFLSQIIVSFSMFSIAALVLFFVNHSIIALGESALENAFAKFAPAIIFIGSVDSDIPIFSQIALLISSVIIILTAMLIFRQKDLT